MSTISPDGSDSPDSEDTNGGVVFMLSVCIGCGAPFAYNPLRVPSIPASLSPTGKREPICKRCWTRRQEYRRQHNLPPEELAANAYEPVPVDELPIEDLGA